MLSPNKCAFLFDFDGTLFDTEYANSCAYSEALRAHGLNFSPDDLLDRIKGKHWTEFLKNLDSQLNDKQCLAIASLKAELYVNYFSKIRVNRSLVSLAYELKRNGCIAIISNANINSIKLILQHFQIDGLFCNIFTPSINIMPKPAPDLYKHGCAELKTEPRYALAFEDSDAGIHSAKAAGVDVVKIMF